MLLGDDEWGASGARLALTVPVCIQAETSQQPQDNDYFLGQRCDQLQVLSGANFISMQGTQDVAFAELGAWRLSRGSQPPTAGDASTLRMMLELENTITRNDIVVTPQKLYLATQAWRTPEYHVGQRRLQRVQQRYQSAQDALEAQLSHASGDRRLDGTNLLEAAAASMDMASLVKRRDDRLSELRQAQVTLPYKELSAPGAWPGSDQALVIQEGMIAVKKKKGGFFGTE